MNRLMKSLLLSVLISALAMPLLAAARSDRLDLNKATAEELESLPKIGPAIAQRIVEYRQKSGGFQRVEELLNVRGIGQKTFELLRDRVTVSTTSDAPAGDK